MQRKDLQAAYLQIIGIACDGANYFACQGVCCTLMFLIVFYVTVRHNFALHFTLQHLYIYRSRAKARGNDFCSSVGRAHVFWRTRDRAFNFHVEEALKFSFFVPVCVSKCIYFWHSNLPHLTLQYLLYHLIRCKPENSENKLLYVFLVQIASFHRKLCPLWLPTSCNLSQVKCFVSSAEKDSKRPFDKVSIPKPWLGARTVSSMHPVCDEYKMERTVTLFGAKNVFVKFDERCATQYDYDKVRS